MPGPQYTSNAQGTKPFDVDSIAIYQYSTDVVSVDEVNSVATAIWSGLADFQKGNGAVYYSSAGAVEEAEAVCIIDASPLPTVKIGYVLVNQAEGKSYIVDAVAISTYAIPFLRLMLKRGKIGFKQPS